MTNSIQNREEWLHQFNKLAAPIIEDVLDGAYTLETDKIRIGVGFPSTGRRGKRIGEAWCSSVSADKTSEIIISNLLDDPRRVAGVLVHENVHVMVGLKEGHGKVFKKVATELGLEGKMTATTEGERFDYLFADTIKALGPYPHKQLKSQGSGPAKQKTRQRKCECGECGLIFRMARAHMDRIGESMRCPDGNCEGFIKMDDA